MSFKNINLRNVRKLLTSSPSEQPKSPERRKFIKTMGFGVLATNPIIKTFKSFSDKSFEVKYGKQFFAVIRDEKIVWEINPDFFGKAIAISVKESNDEIHIQAKNLQIVHTNLHFDIEASILKIGSDWLMNLDIPKLSINKTVDFIDWIDGISPINSSTYLQTNLLQLNTKDKIDFNGTFDCKITNSWKFTFFDKKGIVAHINNKKYYSDKLIITPEQSELIEAITSNLHNNVRIELDNNTNWSDLLKEIDINKEYNLAITDDKPSLNFSLGTTDKNTAFRALWVSEKQGNLSFTNHKSATDKLYFKKYFYLLDYSQKNKPNFFLTAKMGEKDQWISNSIGSFNLTANKDNSELELYGIASTVLEYKLEPKFKSFQPNLKGAIALPYSQENNTLNLQITKKQTNKYIKATKSDVLKVSDKKLEYTPVRPIKVKVLRPEDMVFLEFEFHNFKFTGNNTTSKIRKIDNPKKNIIKPVNTNISNLKITNSRTNLSPIKPDNFTAIELANPQKKGTVIIYFPTQHTLEEAYYETNPNLGDSDTSDPVKLPARHIRAAKSRLVYELQAGHKGFQLTLDELLDWKKYKLKVHPRAWIKLENIPTIHKPTYTIPLKTKEISNKNGNYLKSDNLEYGVKLIQNNKLSRNKSNIYNTKHLDKILVSNNLKTLKPSYHFTSNLTYINKVEPIDKMSTSIEAPALLYISPNQINDFYHKINLDTRSSTPDEIFPVRTVNKPIKKVNNLTIKPVNRIGYNNLSFSSNTSGKITELWHTHLGVKMRNGKISSSLSKLKTIRALWAFEASSKAPEDQPLNQPFRASLDANNRHKLVHLTSNYGIRNYTPQPVGVKKLILSNLGAYIDWQAQFKTPINASNLNIVEWEHLATLGRDHYVKIVEEGYLFPFGHRASLVTVTERKFDPATKAAVNKQRKYIVILEDTVNYQQTDPNNQFIKFPFQEIIITVNKTPNIDKPVDSSLIDDQVHKAFLINVNKKGFDFDMLSIDKEGIEHHLRMPLAFVENSVAENKNLIANVILNYHKQIYDSYTKIGFNGQEVAFAESLVGGDTTFETETLHFGATHYPSKNNNGIKFHPIMRSAKVFVESIDKITNTKKPVEISLEDDKNPGNIFASVLDTVVDFTGGSESSGGFLTPNMPVNALSKIQGAVGGSIDDLKNLNFNPADVFKELDNLPMAKIFGVIKLADLLLDIHLGDSLNEFIKTINSIREDIDEIKNAILLIENKAKEDINNIKESINNTKEELKAKIEKEAKKQIEIAEADLKTKILDLIDTLNSNAPKIPNLKTYLTETAFFAEYKFQPQFKDKSIVVIPELLKLSVDNPQKGMTISTIIKKPFAIDEPPSIKTHARFNKFAIDIIPLLKVKFNYLEFNSGSTVKTDVKVDMDADNPIEFKGALSFVNNLQSIIPNTGFSEDGPYIDLQPTGVKAGFNISVPNIEVGVCMITNISLGAYVMLPFTGAPLTIGFNFCTRNNPFLLTISGFGGGGYFLMVTTLEGIQSLEAAFEFGAAMSLNVGVASGSVTVMGGFYFKMELIEVDGNEVSEVILSGYLRMNGRLSVIGLINVSLEFYLALDAVMVDGKVEKMIGIATVKVKVEVLFFSKTVSITVKREIQGADADPKFIEMVDSDDWQEYCVAFAS